MRRVGQARKRDQNEPAIVRTLKQVGALVIRISEKGAPDLLVLFRQRIYLLEVKSRLGKATLAQAEKTQEGWPVHTVRNERDALEVLGLYMVLQ